MTTEKERKLDHANLISLLSYDPITGVFRWKKRVSQNVKAGDMAGTVTHHGYIHIGIKKTYYKAHRLAWFYIYGSWPENYLDHINLNKTDNRIANLRNATNSENKLNMGLRADNKTGFKGVEKVRSGKFIASTRVNGKLHWLGTFDTAEDAHAAYAKAAETLHKEFARVV